MLIYILYPVHGDKNHHKPDIFIGENIDTFKWVLTSRVRITAIMLNRGKIYF